MWECFKKRISLISLQRGQMCLRLGMILLPLDLTKCLSKALRYFTKGIFDIAKCMVSTYLVTVGAALCLSTALVSRAQHVTQH